MGKKEKTVTDFIFLGSKITADGDCSHEMKRHLLLGREAMTNPDSILKSRDIIALSTKVHIVKAVVFPIVMYGCESWTIKKTAPKNWCLQITVLEKTLESPLDSKHIKPVNPKGNQPWISFRRSDAETEAPVFVPADVKSWLIRNDPDSGKDWGLEEKGSTEDLMIGWNHRSSGHEFEQALGDSKGQGSLVCCSPQGHKELDTT